MKKFGAITNPNIQPRADGYYDRFNRDRGFPIWVTKPKRKSRWRQNAPGVLATLAIVGLVFVVSKPVFLGIISPITDCNIKGNISIDTADRIYHVPGQRYYDATKISARKGERFFCSEAEARVAGWRKSGI